MQNSFSLLDMDVMSIFMIIALDIIITMRFSINCLAIICSPTVIHAMLREATSETYGPRVCLLSYLLPIYFYLHLYFTIYIIKIPKIFILSYYLYQISLLQVVVKGLTTLYCVGCGFLFACVGAWDF